MCRCGSDETTPFCDAPGCEWPEDPVDRNLAIADFLTGARALSQSGAMSFREYLDLCVEFNPAPSGRGGGMTIHGVWHSPAARITMVQAERCVAMIAKRAS